MISSRRSCAAMFALACGFSALPVQAEIDAVTGAVGADTVFVFPHALVAGTTDLSFHFGGGFAPTYPPDVTHLVVVTFEWGPTPTGPWSLSPDHLKSIPGGVTTFFDTGVFTVPLAMPMDAAFVQLHLHAGGLMFVDGLFEHVSIVPEPASALLMLIGTGALAARRRWVFQPASSA